MKKHAELMLEASRELSMGIVSAERLQLAKMLAGAADELEQRPPEPAGAELVSAAPELLEALTALMDMDVKGHRLRDRLQFSTPGRDILDKCNYAIAKALGEGQ